MITQDTKFIKNTSDNRQFERENNFKPSEDSYIIYLDIMIYLSYFKTSTYKTPITITVRDLMEKYSRDLEFYQKTLPELEIQRIIILESEV